MKAVMVNETDGSYQHMTGFDRKEENHELGGKANVAHRAYWNKILSHFGMSVDDVGKSGGSGSNTANGIYGLYTSIDAAAMGWARTFAVLGKGTSVEHSALIYRILIKGTEYFGFTRAIRFSDDKKAHGESPGITDKMHHLPPGAEEVGHIHIHHTDSGPESANFSIGSFKRPGDTGEMAAHSSKTYYLVNNDGDLKVHRPEGYFENEFSPIIARNFYGFDKSPNAQKINGKIVVYASGGQPYPDIIGGHLNLSIKHMNDTYPVLYIDYINGTLYDFNRRPLK